MTLAQLKSPPDDVTFQHSLARSRTIFEYREIIGEFNSRGATIPLAFETRRLTILGHLFALTIIINTFDYCDIS